MKKTHFPIATATAVLTAALLSTHAQIATNHGLVGLGRLSGNAFD
jgi:hypothetical protein